MNADQENALEYPEAPAPSRGAVKENGSGKVDQIMRSNCGMTAYLQPAQDDDEHPLHPEPPPEPSEDLPIPNFERSFSVSFDPQEGQITSGFEP